MNVYVVKKSTRQDKKWQVMTPWRTIHFGNSKFPDYTQHKDVERQAFYLDNHRRRDREKWDDMRTSQFWERWLLWNNPSLEGAIRSMDLELGLVIKIQN
jgi:hypothetical protein